MKRTLIDTERRVRIELDNYTVEETVAGYLHRWSSGASVDGEIVTFEVTGTSAGEAFGNLVEALEATDLLEDRPVPVPEKDKAMLFVLLEGIYSTWGTAADIPDWRDNEYIRGQLELVIETCRVVTDEEWERGDGDIDQQRDRVTAWLKGAVWA